MLGGKDFHRVGGTHTQRSRVVSYRRSDTNHDIRIGTQKPCYREHTEETVPDLHKVGTPGEARSKAEYKVWNRRENEKFTQTYRSIVFSGGDSTLSSQLREGGEGGGKRGLQTGGN